MLATVWKGKITTVLLHQLLPDPDLGDVLHRQESKIVKCNPQEAACPTVITQNVTRCPPK